MSPDLLAAVVAAVVASCACALGPQVMARLPEPEADPVAVDPPADRAAGLTTADPVVQGRPRPRYADLAERPGLGAKLAVIGFAVGATVGYRVGWQPVLAVWVYLVAVGTLLGYIDAQTHLLPTRIIAPSYAVLVVLVGLAAWADGGTEDLARSGWGWLAMGGFYFLMWFVYPKGLGYGDVRLSGLLGLGLGYLGWGQLLVGMYAGFLLGGVGGAVLALAKVVDRKRYPFGPFMLLGALVGLLWGAPFAQSYTSF